MTDKLILDKPFPQTASSSVITVAIPPGDVIEEWAKGRGYVLVYKNVHRPRRTALIFVHGGGFTGLSPLEGSYVYMAQKMCRDTGYTVIVPDYPLAPHRQYPNQPNAILQTRLAFDDKYSEFIVGSDSAGGAIAWSLLLKNPTAFTKAWFLSPWLNLECNSPSYKTREYCGSTRQGDRIFKGNAEEKRLKYTKTAIEYLGTASKLSNGIANPFKSTAKSLSRFPETFILVGDQDSIRDDGLIMGSKLQKTGVKCLNSVYDGMWHDWLLYSQRSCPKEAKAAYQQLFSFMEHGVSGCGVQQDVIGQVNATIVLGTKQ